VAVFVVVDGMAFRGRERDGCRRGSADVEVQDVTTGVVRGVVERDVAEGSRVVAALRASLTRPQNPATAHYTGPPPPE
jgi:hypothetical protein